MCLPAIRHPVAVGVGLPRAGAVLEFGQITELFGVCNAPAIVEIVAVIVKIQFRIALEKRVEAVECLPAIRHPVAVRVGVIGVGRVAEQRLHLELHQVGKILEALKHPVAVQVKAVMVSIPGGISGVERVQLVNQLPPVGHPVVVAIPGRQVRVVGSASGVNVLRRLEAHQRGERQRRQQHDYNRQHNVAPATRSRHPRLRRGLLDKTHPMISRSRGRLVRLRLPPSVMTISSSILMPPRVGM